jgi:hypothetical protein
LEENDLFPGTVSILSRSKHLIKAVPLAGAAATRLEEGDVLFILHWEFDWRGSGLISTGLCA